MKTGYKIDEDLSDDVADVLKAAGFDTETVLDENLLGVSDLSLFAKASSEARILVTADKGFSDERKFIAGPDTGIVIFRLRRESRAAYVRLAEKLALLNPASLLGATSVITPISIRIRRSRKK